MELHRAAGAAKRAADSVIRVLRRWLSALVLAFVAGLAVGVSPVAAHPFGEPQTVRLSAHGSTVTVQWSAPADDLVFVGGAVGALPERREIVFDVGPTGAPEPVGETDAGRLIRSPALAAYLAEHVSVRQDGVACPGEVELSGLVAGGAELTFRCPSEVSEVEVAVTTLTDLHEAYRTVALGDGSTTPDRSLYTIDQQVHTWRFGDHGGTGPSLGQLVPWVGAGLAAVAAGVAGTRARTRRGAR